VERVKNQKEIFSKMLADKHKMKIKTKALKKFVIETIV